MTAGPLKSTPAPVGVVLVGVVKLNFTMIKSRMLPYQPQHRPGGPAEDSLLFEPVDFRVVVKREGNPRVVAPLPDRIRIVHRARLSLARDSRPGRSCFGRQRSIAWARPVSIGERSGSCRNPALPPSTRASRARGRPVLLGPDWVRRSARRPASGFRPSETSESAPARGGRAIPRGG